MKVIYQRRITLGVAFALSILVLILILVRTRLVVPLKISLKETNGSFVVNNGMFSIEISKDTGMVKSLKLTGSDFEINADFGSYNLFYPEFCIEKEDTSPEDTYVPSNAGNVGVSITAFDPAKVLVIKATWETGFIDSVWIYIIPKDKPFFITQIERVVRKSAVYANLQHCTMVTPDMDDSYIVDYEGRWVRTMNNHVPLFSTMCLEHSMFTALNQGRSARYPAFGWYDRETDTSVGMITTWVSPNQRMVISQHGGGSSEKHPGYGEGQWNWFGKADGESIFLNAGVTFGMEIVYILGKGSPDHVIDEFNKQLLNSSCFSVKEADNVFSASWGGRRSRTQPDNPRYNWNFPEASSNYIATQQLFNYRGLSIPQSQNGSAKPQICDLYVKAKTEEGRIIDLTPIGPEVRPSEMSREGAVDHMKGTVTWEVENVANSLTYELFSDSDKLLVSGNIVVSQVSRIVDIYVELKGVRAEEFRPISSEVYDIRFSDPVLGKMGMALYNVEGVDRVDVADNVLKLHLPRQERIHWQFVLWPHSGWIQTLSEITPLHSRAVLEYRDYCRPKELEIYKKFMLPMLEGTSFGVPRP